MPALPPVCKTMCATCPFREGSPYADLAPALAASALGEASRICHSTGSSAINYRTGKPPRICRGARDVQIRFYHQIGFIDKPTNAAWFAKLAEIQSKRRTKIQPQ